MKKGQKQLLFLPVLCLSMAIGGCGKKETDQTDAADMAKTVPNYTLVYQSEQSSETESANKNAEENTEENAGENTKENIGQNTGENAEKIAEKGYYESLVQSKSCQWNKPLAYPNLKDESQFDANDYTNWASAAVESAMVRDGYSVFFQDLNLCKGEKFYGLGAHEMRGSGQQVTAGYQGRIYIMMTVAGGAFDLSVEDGEGTVLWEQENVTGSDQIFLDIDEMPESMIGVLTDHTQEEDKENLFYSVMILAATQQDALK